MSLSDLHTLLLCARQAHQRAEHALSRLLVELRESRRFIERGHSSVEQYAEVELDLGVRQTRALIAIGRRLDELPALAEAFADGRLSWTKAREVARVATPETDAAWTQRACESTSRDLERQVIAASPGDAPPDPKDWQALPARVRITFDFDAAESETLRAALARVRYHGQFGPDVTEGTLIAELARSALQRMDAGDIADSASGPVLGGSAPAAERYRISIRHCRKCASSHVGEHDASDETLSEADCDAEILDLTRTDQPLAHVIPPATRRRVLERDGHCCSVPWCRNRLWVDLHHIRPRKDGGGHRAENLTTLCPTHHRLVHEDRLFITVTDGSLEFTLPTGEAFGARGPRGARLDDVVGPARDAVWEALAEGGGGVAEVARRTGYDRSVVGLALDALRGIGRVVVSHSSGVWHRAAHLVPTRPTWVGADVRWEPRLASGSGVAR